MITIAMHGARPYRTRPVCSSGSLDEDVGESEHDERRDEVVEASSTSSWRGDRAACPTSSSRTFVIAGYIIANRPIGTPSEIRFGNGGSKVPSAIDLIESIGGVSAKSEIDSAFPIAIPIAMLKRTKNGSRRKSSSFASRRAVIGQRPGSIRQSSCLL